MCGPRELNCESSVDGDGTFATGGTTFEAATISGTNIKGHLIKANYSITDSLTFTFTCFLNQLITSGLNAPLDEPNNSAIHVMADLMWKF